MPEPMVEDARLRTRVVRYLKDRDGAECRLEEIVEGTGLGVAEVQAGIDHNHFVDSLRPNLYYGVIQRSQKGDTVTYRFNRVQYMHNRSRWIDATGKKRGGSGGEMTLPRPPNPLRWLRRKDKGG